MHVFFIEFLFFHVFPEFLQLFICLPTQFRHRQGRGVVKQKADRRGQGREGLKTGKNVRTSFMDDPLIKIILVWILAILQQQQLYKFASFSIRLL